MSNSDLEAESARLHAKWPDWDVWWVPHALDGNATWCARLKGDDIKNVVHADNPQDLDQHIQFRVKTWRHTPSSLSGPPRI